MTYPSLSPLGGTPAETARAVNYLLNNSTGVLISEGISTPFDFGALGDGFTDDTTPLLDALESGNVIDGLGKTYAISSELKPTSFAGLRNAKLKWVSTTEMVVQSRALLHIQDLSNWFIDRVDFDLGTIENTGHETDNGRNGLTVDTASGTGYNNRVSVTNCTGTGKGNGCIFNLRNLKTSLISGNLVHDRSMIMGDSGTADNDAMDGFNLVFCDDAIITDNHVYQQTTSTDGGTTYTYDYNRGFALSGLQNCILANNHVRYVGQGFDFSGNLSVNNGNRGLVIIGNTGSYTFSWAFKFVHGMKDCAVTGCVSRFSGRCGFVFNTDDYATATDHTQRLHFSNCHAIQGWAPTYSAENYASPPTGAWSNTWRGVHIIDNNPANGVRNLRFDHCTAYDDSSFMDYGFFSDNTSDTTSNIFRNCEAVGYATAEHNSGIASAAWRTL